MTTFDECDEEGDDGVILHVEVMTERKGLFYFFYLVSNFTWALFFFF